VSGKVTAVPSPTMVNADCDEKCSWWASFSTGSLTIERTAWSAREVRAQARAHTRETGHSTTVVINDETRYEATAPDVTP
jgi:hypothetical protein